MFNAIVQINLFKVERILAIALVQHESRIMRYKGTESGRKIVCCTDLASEVGKFDSTAAARDDSMVGHSVQCRARATAIPCLGWPILGPITTIAWMTLRNHLAQRLLGPHKVEQ